MALGDELRDYRIPFQVAQPCCWGLLGGFTVMISAGRGSRNRNQAEDRDAKPVTLIHPARPRNQQVKGAER